VRPKLQVEMMPLSALVPYAGNARQHPPEQVARLAASIREFGFTVPVLVDDAGVLIAGHGRVLAAHQRGLKEVPAIRLSHLTEAQVRAYRLADNQLALTSTWDESLLAVELRALRDEDFDLGLIGFDANTLNRLLADPIGDTPRVTDEEADAPAPPLPEIPVTRPGDLWLLGSHRLLCGDATSVADVERLLDGARPHLMVTDPPYGVNYDPEWRQKFRPANSPRIGKVHNDHRSDWREAWALFPGDVAYVWHSGVQTRVVYDSLDAAGFVIRSQIIWAKSRFALRRGDYHWQHEPCFYAVRKGASGHWQGARDQTTLWCIPIIGAQEDLETDHSTQKPLECMRRPIVNNSAPGEAVYDPFVGSGTTIIAAEMTERACFAMEIDPRYCDVTIERWQRLTGRTARLCGSQQSFDDLKRQRKAA